jgi:hypothetical protein
MFGTSDLFSSGSLVFGDVLFVRSQCVISGRLYVNPSAASTGSVMRSRDRTVSQSSIGAPDKPVDEGKGGDSEGLGSEGDCIDDAR